MIRVLIVKNIVQLKSIPRLVTYLKDNPFVCDLCGFDSYRIPDETQFYRLLHSLDTDKIHQLLVNINNQYYDISHTSIRNVSIDSKPVLAPTRENNPKYHQRNLTNKNKQPKHNPDATLRYYATHIEYTEEKSLISDGATVLIPLLIMPPVAPWLRLPFPSTSPTMKSPKLFSKS